MRRTSKPDRGGHLHLILAAAIIAAVALTGMYGESLNGLIEEKAPVTRVSLLGDAKSACDADTVDTLIGTLGCGSTQKGAKLSGITFVSAQQKK